MKAFIMADKPQIITQKSSLFRFMAQNFGLVQGVCLLPPGGVLLYAEDVQTSKNNEEIIRKARHKMKITKLCSKTLNLCSKVVHLLSKPAHFCSKPVHLLSKPAHFCSKIFIFPILLRICPTIYALFWLKSQNSNTRPSKLMYSIIPAKDGFPVKIHEIGSKTHELTSIRHDIIDTKYHLRKNNFIIQNEPNFKNNQINLNVCITNSYGNFTIAHLLKTNPKRTQNEPNLLNSQNELKAMYNKGLRSFPPLPPKTKRTQYEPNTNPTKPNFTPPTLPRHSFLVTPKPCLPRRSPQDEDGYRRVQHQKSLVLGTFGAGQTQIPLKIHLQRQMHPVYGCPAVFLDKSTQKVYNQ